MGARSIRGNLVSWLATVAVTASVAVSAPSLEPRGTTRIADPKLAGAAVTCRYLLGPPGEPALVTVSVVARGLTVATIFQGSEVGSATPMAHAWNGRRANGDYVPPGPYTIRVTATGNGTATVTMPLDIVRLGITEIEALPNGLANEFQMVYYRKGGSYAFYATPAIHEYLSVADAGDVSDLDTNDGEPRPPVPVHTAVDSPLLEGTAYEDDRYNYPLSYLMGTQPIFQVTFGASATTSAGTASGCGYPVPGVEIRCVAQDGGGAPWVASGQTPVAPGGTERFTGPALPAEVTRVDGTIRWSWQYRTVPGIAWMDIPGEIVTSHRVYTTIGMPRFRSGASGTQYTGPWVEVAEHFHTFRGGLSLPARTEAEVVEVMMRGYFGQNGGIPAAIEGVMYDCPIVGGDGGASHYYSFNGDSTRLSRLLNGHANGVYVNCSDVASTSAAMMAMLGVRNVRMVRLGSMTLRAIWGIGTPDYTLNLWGGGTHGFNYHHIVTRNGGVDVSDACLAVDVDGNPNALPGTPGFNHDRPWLGAMGYEALLAIGNVTLTVQNLPYLQ